MEGGKVSVKGGREWYVGCESGRWENECERG